MTGSKSRLASLDGLLGPSPAARPTQAPTAAPRTAPEPSETEPMASTGEQPTAQRTAASPRKPKPTTAATPSGGQRRVAMRLDPDLKNRLIERSRRDDLSQADVTRDALEHAVAQGAFEGAFGKVPSTSMFRRPRRGASVTPSTPFEFGVQADELVVIDNLVADHGAKDRTELIVKALETYLS